MTSRLSSRGERGATLIEYALLVALVALACITALKVLGDRASTHYEDTSSSISPSGGGGGGSTDGTTGGTTGGEPTTTEAPTTTAPSSSVSSSCSGRSCSFNVTGAPAGSTYTWSSTTGTTGSGSSFAVDVGGNAKVTYTVTVVIDPGGEMVTTTVTCSGGGGACTVQ